MKKILIPIVLLMGVSCTTQKETQIYQDFSEALNNIQDMREWMIEDQKQGIIDSDYADYYIERLNESEDLLIEHFYKLNTDK
tara:strand:+ start:1562 stop:1807 length:246 start_codon:yes stop_codon:yes gene_type:complete